MFTKTEKRIIVLLVCVLGTGFLIRFFSRASVKEFQERQRAEIKENSSRHKSHGAEYRQYEHQGDSGRIPSKMPDNPPDTVQIDLNSAGKSELMSISGIGPVLARAIIEYRNKKGHFNKVSDLINVKGIGPKKLQKISPFVVINIGK